VLHVSDGGAETLGAIVHNEKVKRPNAIKHGVYTDIAILYGEDRDEFNDLFSSLHAEWVPIGASEEEAVLSIAKAIWRKRRSQKFIESELVENLVNPNHPSYDFELGLIGFLGLMPLSPEQPFAYAANALPSNVIHHLKTEFPREKFNSVSEWTNAIAAEILLKLIPKSKITRDEPAADKWRGLALSAATVKGDLFDKDVALDERLDAMIDRAVKRLIQIKAMKQMLRSVDNGEPDRHRPKLVSGKAAN
jgi:hypothetical protein